jgi:molybdate-binding protein
VYQPDVAGGISGVADLAGRVLRLANRERGVEGR